MSQFSLSSTLALFQSVAAADSDATSSSTSSNSAINTSSGSLSISPGGAGVSLFAQRSPATTTTTTTTSPSATAAAAAAAAAATLYEQQIREPFKITNFKHQQPNISNHLLELQREIKEEEEEIFADINSLINNRSNLYSSFDDETDEIEDPIGARGIIGVSGRGGNIGVACQARTITNTSVSCHPFSITKDNNDIARHQDNSYFHEDEDQGLGHDSDLIGDENVLAQQQQQGRFLALHRDDQGGSSNNNQYHGEHKYAPCNRYTGQQKHQNDEEEERKQEDLDEQQSERELQEQQQQQQQYLELDNEKIHDQEQQLERDEYNRAIQRDLQQLASNLPKPCVFFLEGNCRRSDCKYSHDLSSITCKYWIEGFCFKGEMCPFLHSFAPKGHDSGLLDDDLALAKRELNPTFVIESEADFPSLPLDAPEVTLSSDVKKDINPTSLTKTIKNQILSSNPAVVFKTTKKKRKKG